MRPLLLVLTALWLAAAATYAQEEAPREAIPRGSRPQGDNPQTGTAVPRVAPIPPPSPPPPPGDPRVVSRSRGRTVIVRPPAMYGHPYPPYYAPYSPYSPYSPYGPSYNPYYPYGYGSVGLGFLYYDPYRWHPGAQPAYRYNQRPVSTFDIGELRLDVSPRHAHVYVDGYFAGTLDDFDGAFQAIRLAPGGYRIDLVAPGYETLTFDVRITPAQKIRYRGDLPRRP